MQKLIISLCFASCLIHTAIGQSMALSDLDLQAHYLMEFDVNGNRYGGQLELNTSLYGSSNQFYQLSLGLVEELFVKDERDIDGISGNTLSNILGLTVSNRFRLLESKKLSISNTVYLGWGYRRTQANYTNKEYNMNRDYESSNDFLAFGAYWKAGYQLNHGLMLQGIIKTDFSRLIDPYEPVVFERPGLMYGLGIVYFFR
jgi:hypothetical protein